MSKVSLGKLLGAVTSTVLVVCTALGQETTGSLSGKATDPTGDLLAGVAIEVAGRALQGRRVAVTGTDGRYRFLHLPPGDGYEVTASLEAFATATKKGIHIFLGQEGTANFQMRPAMAAGIIVSAETPLIDVTRTTIGVNITARQFESLPTARTYQSLTTMAPGVSLELAGRRRELANSPSVGASTQTENNYIIEGLSTTDTVMGLSATNLTMNFVEEVQVLTGGYSAEFGRATGGVFNVVTKSGGNEIHGDLFTYYQNHEWSADNIKRRFRGTSTRANGIESIDVGLSIGGPLRRDRLWFFAAYNPTRKTTLTREFVDRAGSFVNEEHEFETDSRLFAGKLSWSPQPQHQIVATVFGDPTVNEGWLGGARAVSPVALRREEFGGVNSILRYTGSLTARTVIEARIGRHQSDANVDPITEIGRTVPRQYDNVDDRNYGGFFYSQDEFSARNSLFAKVATFLPQYELSAGLDLERKRYDTSWSDHHFRFDGPVDINKTIGVQERLVEFIESGDGALDTRGEAAFADSRWRVRPNVQINAGIRYERQILDSANDVNVTDGHFTDGTLDVRKVEQLMLDGHWAPRLGVIWDPLEQGRSKVYFSLGRYFESAALALNLYAMNPGSQVRHRYYSSTSHSGGTWHNPNGSPVNDDWIHYSTSRFSVDDGSSPIDENLEAQFQDELIVGGEHQFGSSWSAGLRLVSRRIGKVIEDSGVFGDPEQPNVLTGYSIVNPGQRTLGSPFRTPKRDYGAVELTVQRRQTTNWHLQSSFVLARARGDYEGHYISGANQLLPNLTIYYDLPAMQQNADGKLPADRPYQFKVHGSYTFPFRLTLSEAFIFSAGSPVSALGPEIPNLYGDGTIFLTPRGSEGRTPDYWTLDVHAHYVILIGRWRYGVNAILDVFNATNNHAALIVEQQYIYEAMPGFDAWVAEDNLDSYGNPRFNATLSPSLYFKTPRLYQEPRSVQIGVKFTY